MEEDKQAILYKLLPTLQETRHLKDLHSLKYYKFYCSEKEAEEVVIATFNNGFSKEINVTLDSGIAMIADIVNRL